MRLLKKKTQPNVSLTQKNIHDTCAFRSLCSSRLSVVSTFVFQFYLDTHIFCSTCMLSDVTGRKKIFFPIYTSFSWQTCFYIDQDLSSCKENKTTWVMKIWGCYLNQSSNSPKVKISIYFVRSPVCCNLLKS